MATINKAAVDKLVKAINDLPADERGKVIAAIKKMKSRLAVQTVRSVDWAADWSDN